MLGEAALGERVHPISENPITFRDTRPGSIQMPMHIRSVLPALSAVALVVACAASETKSSPPIDQSPTPRLDPVAVTAKPSTAAISPDSVKGGDSAVIAAPSITVPSVPGRSK